MRIHIDEAINRLPELIDKVLPGEDVWIFKDNKADIQLVPKRKKFPFGIMPDIKIGDDLDSPLPPDIAGPFGMIDQEETAD